jgi:hypothetical protein
MAVRSPDITYGGYLEGTLAGNVASGIAQGTRKYDIGSQIHDLEPNKAPLTLLTSKIGKEKATDPKFMHFEDERLPRWIQVNGALTTETTITVDTPGGTYVRVGDLLLNPTTGEIYRVTVATSATAFDVTRTFGSVATSVGIADNERLLILGGAMPEASGARPILVSKPGTVTGYTQIFKTPFGVSNTLKATTLWTPSQLGEEERKAAIEHSIDIERCFLYGEPIEDTAVDNYPIRTTGGLRWSIQTNVQSVSGDLTWDAFNQFMRTVFRYGGTTKLILASPMLLGAVQRVAGGNIRIAPSDKTYGLNIGEWISPWGKVMFMNHWLIDDFYNTGGWGFCIDPSQIKYKVLRDTQLVQNIQANDSDQTKHQFITEVGLKIIQEKSMGIIKDVTG